STACRRGSPRARRARSRCRHRARLRARRPARARAAAGAARTGASGRPRCRRPGRPRRARCTAGDMRLPGRLHVSRYLPLRALMAAARPSGQQAGADGQLTIPDACDPLVISFTDEQEEAIRRRSEPLALSAAAGSGKTSVLVERFVGAVREDGIAPGRILAITFTERAAGELRSRVRARLLELGDREAARDTEAALVGTFHGFCARLLRSHPLAAGLDPEFAISDEGLAGRLRELAFSEALTGFIDGRAEAVDIVAAYGLDRVRWMIEAVYAELRSRGQRLPRLPETALAANAEDLDSDAAPACALLGDLLERFGLAYDRLKGLRGVVDFDDLELLAGALL